MTANAAAANASFAEITDQNASRVFWASDMFEAM